MHAEPPASAAPNRRIALLIDADNVSHHKIGMMLAELSKYGTANIRRAYGDWGSDILKGWKAKLHDFAIRPIQQFSYTSGKNATDIALVIDAMELLYTQKLDAFCIASSDADFTPLVMQLRANGHDVYGFGERKTPMPFVNACTTFLYLDIADGDVTPASEEPVAKAAPIAEAPPKAVRHVADPTKLAAAVPVRPLSSDDNLVAILRGAVAAAAGDDGWATMPAVGQAAKRQAPIDPRNYAAKNFTALLEATKLFDIVKAKAGQSYVADKRNKDRSVRPGM